MALVETANPIRASSGMSVSVTRTREPGIVPGSARAAATRTRASEKVDVYIVCLVAQISRTQGERLTRDGFYKPRQVFQKFEKHLDHAPPPLLLGRD